MGCQEKWRVAKEETACRPLPRPWSLLWLWSISTGIFGSPAGATSPLHPSPPQCTSGIGRVTPLPSLLVVCPASGDPVSSFPTPTSGGCSEFPTLNSCPSDSTQGGTLVEAQVPKPVMVWRSLCQVAGLILHLPPFRTGEKHPHSMTNPMAPACEKRVTESSHRMEQHRPTAMLWCAVHQRHPRSQRLS